MRQRSKHLGAKPLSRFLLIGSALVVLLIANPASAVSPAKMKTLPYTNGKVLTYTSTKNATCYNNATKKFVTAAPVPSYANLTSGRAGFGICAMLSALGTATARAGFFIPFKAIRTGMHSIQVNWSGSVRKVGGTLIGYLTILDARNASVVGTTISLTVRSSFGNFSWTPTWNGSLLAKHRYLVESYFYGSTNPKACSSFPHFCSATLMVSEVLNEVRIT